MTKWISVAEKMPEADGRYIVNEQWNGDMSWRGVCSLRNGKWDSPAVTHWQPLPEAPKEEIKC